LPERLNNEVGININIFEWLTGYSLAGFPVLTVKTCWNIAKAWSFLPRVIKNLGLSGNRDMQKPPIMAGREHTIRKICHDLSSEKIEKDV
jgi:hypothetical protein